MEFFRTLAVIAAVAALLSAPIVFPVFQLKQLYAQLIVCDVCPGGLRASNY